MSDRTGERRQQFRMFNIELEHHDVMDRFIFPNRWRIVVVSGMSRLNRKRQDGRDDIVTESSRFRFMNYPQMGSVHD